MKFFLTILMVTLIASCSKDWSYQGKTAPQYWGDLKEEYRFCKVGHNQSPIDVDFKSENTKYVTKGNHLDFSYSSLGVTKEKDSNATRFLFDHKDYMTWRKRKYHLKSVYFHHPSEHKINGEQQVLEMQVFHKSDGDQWVALALFINVGEENPEFNKLIELLKEKGKDVWSEFNLGQVMKGDESFFYEGSLTTPPCTEGMKWFVMKNPIQMSKEQINDIIKLALDEKTNARPTQNFHSDLY